MKVSKEFSCQFGLLLAEREFVDWGTLQREHTYYEHLKIYNPTHRSISVKIHKHALPFRFVHSDRDSTDLSVCPVNIAPRQSVDILMEFKLADSLELGNFSSKFYLDIDGVFYLKAIDMTAVIVENFDDGDPLQPSIDIPCDCFHFDTIALDKILEHSFLIRNVGKEDLIIRKIETTCTCIEYSIDGNIIHSRDSAELRVAFRPEPVAGAPYKVRLICNDPKRPIVELVLKGYVAP